MAGVDLATPITTMILVQILAFRIGELGEGPGLSVGWPGRSRRGCMGGRARRGHAVRAGRTRALIEVLSKFDIASNIGGLLDKSIQGVFLLEMGNHPFTNRLVQAAEVVTSDPGVGLGGFVSELEDKHLEFGGVFVGSSLGSLEDGFGAFEDVSLAVGGQMLFFKGLEEHFERGEGFDTLVRIDVPDLRVVAEPGGSKAGLFVGGDFRKVHVFFDAEGPSGDGGN